MSDKTGVSNLPGLRKSIRRTAGVIARRRLNSDSAAAASPKIATKRKRADLLAQEGPSAKRWRLIKTFFRH